jgi:hypothetical protein
MSLTRTLFAAAVALIPAGVALAHHGWSWAETEVTTMIGVVEEVSLTPPHPSLKVTDDDGTLWQIDLGNPRLTAASGFAEGSATPGDTITVLGNRSLDPDEKLMKAVRITVNGQAFDIYPDRIPTD